MAKPSRFEYPGAIHHAMSRGNPRRSVFEDAGDYQLLLEGLEQTVGRFGSSVREPYRNIGSRLGRDRARRRSRSSASRSGPPLSVRKISMVE